MKNFEVSFNSPQCGWMSVGFKNGENEFNSTTANAPYNGVLAELLNTLISLSSENAVEKNVKWNRNPEEFDFIFAKSGETARLEIIEYPSKEREIKSTVFTHQGTAKEIVEAFYQTFSQLYEDRNTDEFEQNWRQPFPFAEFETLKYKLKGKS
jgi:hypothetical protein